MNTPRHRPRVTTPAVALVALPLLLTACASSSKSSSPTPTGTPASASASAGVAAAKAFVAAHTDPPTSILVTTPLSGPPPKGKSVVYLGPISTSIVAQGKGVKAAAAKLGWSVKTITFPQTAEGAANAMAQAVALHPDAVLQAGFPVAVFPNEVKALKNAKIPYVNNGTTDKQSDGVVAVAAGPEDFSQRGLYLANWVVADSNGEANIVDYNLSTYPTVNALSETFKKTVLDACPTCKVDVQEAQGTAIGTTLPSQIVSYLQAHPKVNYVLATYGDMTIGLQSALASAGLTNKVKVLSQSGSLQALVDGVQVVNVPEADTMIGWLMVDAALRAMLGMTVDQSQYGVLPHNFVTKDNVGDPKADYAGVPNFEPQFLKLWGLS